MTLSDEGDLRRFTVRNYTVDPARNTITGPFGEVHLEPKVMSVLVMLARQRDDVVSRSELIDRIWGVEHGADESLTRAISQLRKAFNDSRGEPQFIETIPKRGYRFLAPVAPIEDQPDETGHASLREAKLAENATTSNETMAEPFATDRSPASSRIVMPAVVAAVFILAGIIWITPHFDQPSATDSAQTVSETLEPTLAVLPFVNMSANEGNAYFADGLTEEITNSLATLPDLMVTARTSAFHYKGKNVPISEIAAALGVTHVVEGSVRWEGNRVRITAQLARTSDGFHLWSNTYDRTQDDVFEIQTDISHRVAEALGVVLDDNKRALMASVGIRNVEAFVAYQRGLSLFNKAHLIPPKNTTLLQANAEFNAALAIEPDIADAYFRQTDLYNHILTDRAVGDPSASEAVLGISTEDALHELREGIENAYEHANDRAHQQVIRATQVFYSESWRGFNNLLAEVLANAPVCRYARPAEEDGMNYGLAKEVYEQALRQLKCDPFGLFAEDAAASALILGLHGDALRIIEKHERAVGTTANLSKTKLDVLLAIRDFSAAKRHLASNKYLGGLHELRIAAAAGCAGQWAPVCARWRADLNADKFERLDYAIYAAAMLGERSMANEYARRIDDMVLGVVVLNWLPKWCLCGAAFDLEATPNFAERLAEADMLWPPPSPIKWPLKDW